MMGIFMEKYHIEDNQQNEEGNQSSIQGMICFMLKSFHFFFFVV
jgi:hypothetical protein